MKKVLIIAHRGASGYAPENTIIAFRKAIEMGADGLEFDVHLSKDRHLVVCHDEKIDRTTNGKGYIKDLTLKELKQLDVGSWYSKEYHNEKIPTLEEVIELTKEYDILLNIELKNGIISYDNLEEKVIDVIRKNNIEKNVIISSFNHYSIKKIRKLDSGIETGILYVAGMVDPWLYAKYLGVDAIHPIYYSISPKVIEGCENSNIKINTYTVNNKEHIKAIAKLGVNGIITNYPDRAKNVLDFLFDEYK